MTRHLLVTNDFPPKVGGIQSYLWELWRRLPADSFVVYTTPHQGAVEFDAAQPFEVIRSPEPVLVPNPLLRRRIDDLARRHEVDLVVIDPALPLGLIGPALERPYGLVIHGAEITVPGRLPGTRQLLGRVLRGAVHVIAAGGYPAAEARRAARSELPVTEIPPGVDTDRFHPLDLPERLAVRRRFGLAPDSQLVVSVSRLVPRKGMDVLVDAATRLAPSHPSLQVAIAGSGRDERRLQARITTEGAPVTMLGRVADRDLPGLYGCGDVFAMLCRNRWGGLEQEGFGIVFLEAAAAGVPQVAGRSGGAGEAVAHERTGLVVDDPADPVAVATALDRLLGDPELRAAMAAAGRTRAESSFSYAHLAARLHDALQGLP